MLLNTILTDEEAKKNFKKSMKLMEFFLMKTKENNMMLIEKEIFLEDLVEMEVSISEDFDENDLIFEIFLEIFLVDFDEKKQQGRRKEMI